ncbi:response regulator [Limibacter armeniacum]|uniref:ATP-binding response regulator n=1 Tax=Limibacter armeniacum TaxID=466084 RepID=UPI002FE5F6AC
MKKILVIEDEKGLRDSIAEMLEITGYDVETAVDGADGITRATTQVPDLILCDVMMPNVDGYDVLKFIRSDKTLQATPFIFLTAKVERQDIRIGMNLSADDYITKPFDYDELIEAIEVRLERVSHIRQDLTEIIEEVHTNMENHKGIMDPQTYEEINNLRQILSTKNEALDKYCYMNSHKLRAPLCRILGLVDLIERSGDNNRELLDKLKESADDLDGVTKEINLVLSNAMSENV